jgi:hypothetical protein
MNVGLVGLVGAGLRLGLEASTGFSCRQFRVRGGWIAKSFMRIKDSIALIRTREPVEESALITRRFTLS